MKIRARIAVYGLLALALWQCFVSYRQDHCIRQQAHLIRLLWDSR